MNELQPVKLPVGIQEATNHVANYEPKALTWLAMHALSTATIIDLNREVSYKARIESHCGDLAPDLVEAGFASVALRESRYSSRIVRYFGSERENDTLPVIGTTLPWARDHQLPLKPFLSVTNARGGVRQRGPVNSIQILAAIVDGQRLVDDIRSRREGMFSVGRLEEMLKDDIVRADEEINRFVIHDPRYRGTRPFAQVSAEVRAVYEALADAKDLRPNDAWSVDEILQLAKIRHMNEGTASWEKRIRKNIRLAAYATKAHSLSGVIQKKEYVYGAYRINPIYAEAVANLVERFIHLNESNSRQRKQLADEAVELYADSGTVHDLVARGFDSSPKHSYSLEKDKVTAPTS